MGKILSNGRAVNYFLTAPQVYQVTHDSNGNSLSSTQRSYISFTWGDYKIEDFDFIVTNDGNRYRNRMYAPFQDLTTTYDIIDGQHFWKTTYEPNELYFTLSTDGVSEGVLQSFRNYFQPGIERELQLSEFPNRGIMARIAEAPDYEMLPFEEQVLVQLNNQTYNTSTTIWKGSVHLHFIMDDPFWYSKQSYYDMNNLTEDGLKAIIEDGIPHISMFSAGNKNIFLGNGTFINTSGNQGLQSNSNGITMTANSENYVLYYCGTAPEKPTINFTFKANQFAPNTKYCNAIGNEYTNNDYGRITIGNKTFEYTLPSLLNAYNQAINIASTFKANDDIINFKKRLRDGLNHFYIRMWALAICEHATGIANTNGGLYSNFFSIFATNLQSVFHLVDGQCPCSCSINSATGEAITTIVLNTLSTSSSFSVDQNNTFTCIENSGDMIRSQYITIDERTLPDFNFIAQSRAGNDIGHLGNNNNNNNNNSNNNSTDTPSTIKFATISADKCLPVISNYTLNNVKILYRYKYL